MSSDSVTTKPILRALAGETLTPPPIWLMRQAGRYLPEYRRVRERAGGFLDLCYNPALAAEVTLQPITRFGFDAAILFSDILIVPHALGCDVRFDEGHGPCLEPVRGTADIERLSDGIGDRAAPIFETVARVADALPGGTALIGFAGAPWTVATYMVEGGTSRDFAATKLWAFSDPDGFQRLIDKLVAATADYLIAQAAAGAEVLQLFDSWAGALPESGFERWCIVPTRDLVTRLKAACPEVPVIGFPRGAGPMTARYAEATGVDAVSLDSAVPAAWAVDALQARWTLQGNLDPLYLVAGGRAMTEAAATVLDALGHGPMIFNLGHGVVPQTPPAHVSALVEAVRAWRPDGATR